MAKRIEVEVDGARASFVLAEDWAPKTAAALWESIPFEGPIVHGKLSGDVCYFKVEHGPLRDLPDKPEMGLSSIYQGYMSVAPMPGRGFAEVFISYGLAEYRGPIGRQYATPVAELEGDGSALFDALRRVRTEGQNVVAVRRIDG